MFDDKNYFSLPLQGGETAVVANRAGDFWGIIFGLGFSFPPSSFLKCPGNNVGCGVVLPSSTWQFG